MMTLVRTLDECEKANHWPPEQTEESDLMLPDYATNSEVSLEDFAEVEE